MLGPTQTREKELIFVLCVWLCKKKNYDTETRRREDMEEKCPNVNARFFHVFSENLIAVYGLNLVQNYAQISEQLVSYVWK